MNVEVRCSERCFARSIKTDFVKRFATVASAACERIRLDTCLDNCLLQAQGTQRLYDVGADDDACTDAGKGIGLFVHGDGKSGPLKMSGKCQSAETCSDHGNPCVALHVPSLFILFMRSSCGLNVCRSRRFF